MTTASASGAQAETSSTLQQCASAVLMVRPAAFNYNPETAASNALQQSAGGGADNEHGRALTELESVAHALRSEGIVVCEVADTPHPPKPDAVFPNNWVSFHEDGTVVLYPMLAQSRRRERRLEIVETVADQLGFRITRRLDLTAHEAAGRFLEGTGSLVLDHAHRIAYACESPRTHQSVVHEWARELGYKPVIFNARDRRGVPFYHTNVMMSVGSRACVVGIAAIDPADRRKVEESLRSSGREVVAISQEEIEGFAGNVLELASWDEALGDCGVLVMSESAKRALRPEAYATLAATTDTVLTVSVPTIQRLGGGGVRCMLAEVFLPPSRISPV